MARGLVAYEFMRTCGRALVAYFQGNGQCLVTKKALNIGSVLNAPPLRGLPLW
jgi:hypothetical protein